MKEDMKRLRHKQGIEDRARTLQLNDDELYPYEDQHNEPLTMTPYRHDPEHRAMLLLNEGKTQPPYALIPDRSQHSLETDLIHKQYLKVGQYVLYQRPVDGRKSTVSLHLILDFKRCRVILHPGITADGGDLPDQEITIYSKSHENYREDGCSLYIISRNFSLPESSDEIRNWLSTMDPSRDGFKEIDLERSEVKCHPKETHKLLTYHKKMHTRSTKSRSFTNTAANAPDHFGDTENKCPDDLGSESACWRLLNEIPREPADKPDTQDKQLIPESSDKLFLPSWRALIPSVPGRIITKRNHERTTDGGGDQEFQAAVLGYSEAPPFKKRKKSSSTSLRDLPTRYKRAPEMTLQQALELYRESVTYRLPGDKDTKPTTKPGKAELEAATAKLKTTFGIDLLQLRRLNKTSLKMESSGVKYDNDSIRKDVEDTKKMALCPLCRLNPIIVKSEDDESKYKNYYEESSYICLPVNLIGNVDRLEDLGWEHLSDANLTNFEEHNKTHANKHPPLFLGHNIKQNKAKLALSVSGFVHQFGPAALKALPLSHDLFICLKKSKDPMPIRQRMLEIWAYIRSRVDAALILQSHTKAGGEKVPMIKDLPSAVKPLFIAIPELAMTVKEEVHQYMQDIHTRISEVDFRVLLECDVRPAYAWNALNLWILEGPRFREFFLFPRKDVTIKQMAQTIVSARDFFKEDEDEDDSLSF